MRRRSPPPRRGLMRSSSAMRIWLRRSAARPGATSPGSWLYAQETLLVAARAAGLQAIDGPYLDIRDGAGLRVRAEHVRSLGFDGKWAVHPDQLKVINTVFTPTVEEVARACAVLERARRRSGTWCSCAGRRDDRRGKPEARRTDRRARSRRGRRRGVAMSGLARQPVVVGGPWFEELDRGQIFEDAPGLTVTAGHAALHQALVGDRLRLALDTALCREVTGRDRPLVHPNLVCDVAIGQSTGPSQRVRGNLFYRGLVLARPVFVGDTLRTRTEIVGLKQNRRRSGAPASGLVAMRVRTTDEHDEPVLDFWRCPMIPLRDPEAETGHADDFTQIPQELDQTRLADATPHDWRLDRLRAAVPGPYHDELEVGPNVPGRGRRDRDRRARTRAPDAERCHSSHGCDPEPARPPSRLWRAHDLDRRGSRDARDPRDRDDRRLEELRAHRPGVRGRCPPNRGRRGRQLTGRAGGAPGARQQRPARGRGWAVLDWSFVAVVA